METALNLREFVAALNLEGFTLKPADPDSFDKGKRVDLQHEDGYTVVLNVISYGVDTGKLSVGVFWPSEMYKSKPYDFQAPGIKVSPLRGAEAVAKDINRRFIPALQEAHKQLAERYAQDTAYKNLSKATTERVARAFLALDGVRDSRVYLGGIGSAEVSGDRVKLELHVTPEQAEKIAKLLLK